jgi:hypothetical protein
MKLLFAYTGRGIAGAGTNLPNAVVNTWQPLGASPFLTYQIASNQLNSNGEVLTFNQLYTDLQARSFDVLSRLVAGEVLTFGWQWYGTVQTPVSGPTLLGIKVNNPSVLSICPILWTDLTVSATDVYLYFECTIDPIARTISGYINGRLTRTLTIPDNVSFNDVNLKFWDRQTGGSSQTKQASRFYAAIFNKSEGDTHLSSWECEDLTEISSDLRAENGAFIYNTVTDSWKSVGFALPAKPLDAVAADLKALNPQSASKLYTELTDGTTTTALTIDPIGAIQLDTEFGNTTNGRQVPGISPSKQATKLTLRLKADVK